MSLPPVESEGCNAMHHATPPLYIASCAAPPIHGFMHRPCCWSLLALFEQGKERSGAEAEGELSGAGSGGASGA